ncbi:MAG: YbjN domain-containing protein [Terracidiphilus sp.]|nr:YbjN domain-containing protein [Terracidiphilus sp.]
MLSSCLRRIGTFALLTAAFAAFSLAATAQAPTPARTRLVRLMQAAHLDYKTTESPTTFVILFAGDNIKDGKLILTVSDDEDSELVMFVTIASKNQIPKSSALQFKLLKANYEYDYVKIGFDNDDDLSMRIDTSLRLADARFLGNMVTQLEKASDELYGKLQPSLLR